jgi:heme-degrading monooxygenase HmoA
MKLMNRTIDHDQRGSEGRPFVLINSFTPKPGKLDELAALLEAARDCFADRMPGFHGGRVYRDVDGSSALLIGVFETEDHYESWITTDLFASYREKILPLIESMGQSRIEAGNARKTARHRTPEHGRDDMAVRAS